MKGSGLVAISAFFFATYGVWSKLMAGTFGEFNQAIIKAIILLTLLLPIGIKLGWYKKISRQDWKWFIAIALSGGLNQAPYYFGFMHLTVGTATLLFYTALTLGSYIIGAVFFSEKIDWGKQLAFLMAVGGLVIIYKFQLGSGQLWPAICTIFAGLMGATGVALSKKLSSNYSEIQIITGYLVAMIILNPIFSIIAGETMPVLSLTTPWMAQMGYAVSYILANTAVVAGFRHLDPSIGALVGLLEVIFAAIFGIVIFSEVLTWQLVIGGGLILMAMSLPELVKLKK